MGVIRKKTAARGGESGVKYHCDICSADITSTVRIRCAHSACNEYDLCVLCFSKGESSNNHQPATHPYRVIEQNSVPIYDKNWGADEELLLLEGAETYGLGSWADIADHIGGYRNKDEVRNHYEKIYLNSSKFPLPERASPNDNTLAEELPREEFQARKKRRIEDRKEAAKNAPPATPKQKPTASVPACHEVQGYMPGRLEFETEFMNDAEEAVQHMQFDPGDGRNARSGELEPEMELKMTVMDIYNSRLTARAERKKVIFEHGLLDYRRLAQLEKRRTREERELLAKAKPFARMMNAGDFELFARSVVDEHNLRLAVAQLQEWRRGGVGDLASGERYELDKAARAQRAQPMGSMDRERFATSQRAKAAQQAPETPSAAAALVSPDLVLQPYRRPGMQHQQALTGDAPATAASSSFGAATADDRVLANGHGNNGSPTPQPSAAGGATGTTTAKQRPAVQPLSGVAPLAMSPETTADLHLLTSEEAELCRVVRILPKPYLLIKEQIMREALKSNGALKKKQAKDICKLDTQKGGKIFDFLVSSGFIGKA